MTTAISYENGDSLETLGKRTVIGDQLFGAQSVTVSDIDGAEKDCFIPTTFSLKMIVAQCHISWAW